MLFKKLSFVVLTLHLISGCGFTPLLQSTNKTADNVHLSVAGIEGYLNHRFYQSLNYKLGLINFDKSKKYQLKVSLGQTYYDISYGKDATALRTQNTISAAYEFYDNKKLLRKGKLDTIASFNLDSRNEFMTMTNRLGSDEKVIEALAEDVAREIALVAYKG